MRKLANVDLRQGEYIVCAYVEDVRWILGARRHAGPIATGVLGE